MDSDEEIFLTQSKFGEVQSSGSDTDTVLNDILDLEGERKMQNFDIKLDIFIDISDDDILKKSDRALKEAQSDNIPDIVKSDEKGGQRFAEPINLRNIKCVMGIQVTNLLLNN